MIRKREEQFAALALALTAHRSNAQVGDALVRLGTVALVLSHREAAVPLGVGHESLHANALALVTAGVGRVVCAVHVVLAGNRDRCLVDMRTLDHRVARVLEVEEVLLTGTVREGVLTARERIVHDALLVHFAGSIQRDRLTDASFHLSAGHESVLAGTHPARLVAVRILRVARTLATDLVRVCNLLGYALARVSSFQAGTIAGTIDARGVVEKTFEGRTVRVSCTAKIEYVIV